MRIAELLDDEERTTINRGMSWTACVGQIAFRLASVAANEHIGGVGGDNLVGIGEERHEARHRFLGWGGF